MRPSLQLIERFEISGSTSAFSCDNVFSDSFDVYNIVTSGICLVGTTQTNLSLRFIDNSGNVKSGATDYTYAVNELPSHTSFTSYVSSGASLIQNAFGKDDGIEGSSSSMFVYNPASSSTFTHMLSQATGDQGTNQVAYKVTGAYITAETIRGFQILETSTRPFDEGKISVYGVV